MINKWSALILCLGLTGCVSAERSQLAQEYSAIYDNALNMNDITTIAKNESYQELKQRLSNDLTSHGYAKVIFVDPRQGFLVLAKEGDAHRSQIILKYTRTTGDYNIRVDLARASEDPGTDVQVTQDIQEIADLIRNE